MDEQPAATPYNDAEYNYSNPAQYAAWINACVEMDRLKGRSKPRQTKNSQTGRADIPFGQTVRFSIPNKGVMLAAEGLLQLVSNVLRFSHFSPKLD